MVPLRLNQAINVSYTQNMDDSSFMHPSIANIIGEQIALDIDRDIIDELIAAEDERRQWRNFQDIFSEENGLDIRNYDI